MRPGTLLHSLVIGILASCAVPAADNPPPASGDPVVAASRDWEIRLSDVDRYIGREATDLLLRLYQLRSQALNSMIEARLLRDEAAARHMSELDLLDKAAPPRPKPPQSEIDRLWSENRDGLRAYGEALGRYRMSIDLTDNARMEDARALLESLKQRAGVNVLLQKPDQRVGLKPGGGILGANPGPVMLSVFLDYECPYCLKLESDLKELLADPALTKAGLSIQIKNLPLQIHHTAFEAAVAAVCGNRAGVFPRMHEELFAMQDHSAENLRKTAAKLGIDPAAFESCLKSEDVKAAVLADIEEAGGQAFRRPQRCF